MAVQGKGILGNPKGVIGSINCLTRYGQGILQSRGKPLDSFNRYWNLLSYKLTIKLTFLYQLASQTSIDWYAANKPTGSTTFDYYIAYNLLYAREKEITNFNYAYLPDPQDYQFNAVLLSHNWYSQKIELYIPPENPYWNLAGTHKATIRSILPNGTFGYSDNITIPIVGNVLTFDVSNTNYSQAVAYRLGLWQGAPFNNLSGMFLDFFDPKFVIPT